MSSKQAGFTLVEVAVAMIVLGLVLVGLFPILVNSIQLAVKNQSVATANRIVSTELDHQRNALVGLPCVTGSSPIAALPTQGYQVRATLTCSTYGTATLSVAASSNDSASQVLSEASTIINMAP